MSQDRATALQPGNRARLRLKKKKKVFVHVLPNYPKSTLFSRSFHFFIFFLLISKVICNCFGIVKIVNIVMTTKETLPSEIIQNTMEYLL